MDYAINNLVPLPFYGPCYDWDGVSFGDQDNYKPWVYGRIYPLITPLAQWVPTTQIAMDLSLYPGFRNFDDIRIVPEGQHYSTGVSIRSQMGTLWKLNNVYSGQDIDYKVVCFAPNVDYIMSLGTSASTTLNLNPGRYYLVCNIGDDYWYSDVYTLVGDEAQNCIRMDWWDDDVFFTDDGLVFYGINVPDPLYKNVLYLLTDIGKPKYEFEEEGEDRDGYFFAQKQISKKVYKFTFLAPEYLCDCLRLLRMADHVSIKYHGNTYTPTEITPTFTWQEDGSLASVAIEFETNTVAKKIGWGQLPSI
jgi:hypothetical protein